jgi:transcriptional regulator with XRE-family HTH domain
MAMTTQRGDLAVEQLEQLLGTQVRSVRRSRGLTQQQVADLANTSLGALKNLEGGHGATTRTLARVLRALEVDDWLGTLDVPKSAFNPLDLPRVTPPRDRRARPRSRQES